MAGRRSNSPVDASDGMSRGVDGLRQKEKDLLKQQHRVEALYMYAFSRLLKSLMGKLNP